MTPAVANLLQARVASWSVCRPGDAAPAVPEVESGLRRRLSRVSRMALRCAFDCARSGEGATAGAGVRTVFASRHGELGRSTAVMEQLAAGEEASPMAFSMSVLNAGMGVMSIARGDLSPSTAISAGPASFEMGLLEALGQYRADPSRPVVFVYADEAPPPVWGVEGASPAFAIALALREGGEGAIAWRPSPTGAESQVDAARVAEWFESREAARWVGFGEWHWSPAPRAADASGGTA